MARKAHNFRYVEKTKKCLRSTLGKITFPYMWNLLRHIFVTTGYVKQEDWGSLQEKLLLPVLGIISTIIAAVVFYIIPYLISIMYSYNNDLPQANNKAEISILVAQLEGDDNGSQTRLVRTSLRRVFERAGGKGLIQVAGTKRTIRQKLTANIFTDYKGTEVTGQKWLNDSGFDVLIWGVVLSKDKVLQLSILTKTNSIKMIPEKINAVETLSFDSNYLLSKNLELPENFRQDLGLLIAFKIMKQFINTSYDHFLNNSEPFFVSMRNGKLDDVVKKIYSSMSVILQDDLLEESAFKCYFTGMSAAFGGELGVRKKDLDLTNSAIVFLRNLSSNKRCMEDYGMSLSTHILLAKFIFDSRSIANDDQISLEAISILKKEIAEWYRRHETLDLKSKIQVGHAFGEALLYFGMETSSIELLQAMVTLNKQLIKFMNVASLSKKVNAEIINLSKGVISQFRLEMGIAHRVMGQLQQDNQHLDKSIEELKRALLDINSFDKIDLKYKFEDQNYVGKIYSDFLNLLSYQNKALKTSIRDELAATYRLRGEQVQSKENYTDAISILNSSLVDVSAENDPLRWAYLKTQIGINYRLLGELDNDRGLLNKAVSNFNSALQVRTRKKMPADWAITSVQLAIVLQLLDSVSLEEGRLSKILNVYESVLKIYGKDKSYSSQKEFALGRKCSALSELANRSSTKEIINESIQACKDARNHISDKRTSDWVTLILGGTYLNSGELYVGTNKLKQGQAIFHEMITSTALNNDSNQYVTYARYYNALSKSIVAFRKSNISNIVDTVDLMERLIKSFPNDFRRIYLEATQIHFLSEISELTRKTKYAEEAIKTCRSTLETSQWEQKQNLWAYIQISCAQPYLVYGVLEKDTVSIDSAIAKLNVALGSTYVKNFPRLNAYARKQLAKALSSLGVLKGQQKLIRASLKESNLALAFYKKIDATYFIDKVEREIEETKARLTK